MDWDQSPLLERNAIRDGLGAAALEPAWAARWRERVRAGIAGLVGAARLPAMADYAPRAAISSGSPVTG